MSRKSSLTSTLNSLARTSKRIANSTNYSIEVSHEGLNKYQVIKAKTRSEVEQKAQMKMAQWNDMWARKVVAEEKRQERERIVLDKEQKLRLASDRTEVSQKKLSDLEKLLLSSVDQKLVLKWDSLKKIIVL